MSLENYILYPERDSQSWGFYKRQEASDWSAEEFDFTKEKEEYLESPPNIQRLIKTIFGFFLIGDGLISEELVKLLQKSIDQKNWPKFFYLSMQLKIENTHSETYSKAALTIVPVQEHQEIYNMCKDLECIKLKGDWIKKNIEQAESEGLDNIACACGEGIFFVSLFAYIFYLRSLGMFKNFIESNEQISKDETLHRDEKCAEAKRTLKSDEHEKAYSIIKSAVEVEKKHCEYLLSIPVAGEQADRDTGLTRENLFLYIEKLSDQICDLAGLEPIYNSDVELGWMKDINLSQKSNFYERNVIGSYRRFDPNTINETERDDCILNPEDEDF